MESVKAQLLEAQKERGRLLRWKLAVIAAIGTVGLGLSESQPVAHVELVLGVLPLASSYIDLLCRSLSIRTKLISNVIAERNEDATIEARLERAYQAFDQRRSSDALEGYALVRSTQAISAALVIGGLALDFVALQGFMERMVTATAFVVAGIAGFVGSSFIESEYERQKKLIGAAPEPSKSA